MSSTSVPRALFGQAGAANIRRFKMQEQLNPAKDSAEAKLYSFERSASVLEAKNLKVKLFDPSKKLTIENEAIVWAIMAADANRWEVLSVGPALDLLPFYLNANLAKNGFASANLMEFTGGSWGATGDPIVVFDSFGLGPAASTKSGWCIYKAESARYEVVSLPQGSDTQLVMFILAANLARGGSASAFIRFWDGDSWEQSPTPITVFDSSELGPALTEGLGVAWLNPDSGRYEIITLRGGAALQWTMFRLGTPLTRGSFAGAFRLVWNGVDDFIDGDAIYVYDDAGLFGPAQADWRGLAFLNPDNPDRWEIASLNQDLYFFELTSGLEEGGSASAKSIEWDGAAWVDGAAGTVYDSAGKFGPGQPGDRGVMQLNHNSNRWEIISLNRGGGDLLYFELRADLERGESALAYIREWDDGLNEWKFGDEEAADITVYDVSELGPGRVAQFGVCQLNSTSGLYEIISLQQNIILPFELTTNLTTVGASANGKLKRWGISWTVDPDEPTIEVFDTNKLGPALAGDSGSVWLDPSSGRYEIIQLQRSGGLIVKFELTTDMERGGIGNAWRTVWSGAAWETDPLQPIVVFDSDHRGPARIGDTGIAWNSPESGRLEILSLRLFNGAIHFELKDPKTKEDTKILATVTQVMGDVPNAIGEIVWVHDPAYNKFKGKRGTGGRATYSGDLTYQNEGGAGLGFEALLDRRHALREQGRRHLAGRARRRFRWQRQSNSRRQHVAVLTCSTRSFLAMSAVAFTVVAAGVATGTSAKTIAQVKAAAQQRVLLKQIDIGFSGVSASDEPILVEVVRQTSGGTMTGVTPVKINSGDDETLQVTASKEASVEPSGPTVLAARKIHPQGRDTFFLANIFAGGLPVKGGEYVGVRVLATQNVNATVTIYGEE